VAYNDEIYLIVRLIIQLYEDVCHLDKNLFFSVKEILVRRGQILQI